jgi:hypothetical protein
LPPWLNSLVEASHDGECFRLCVGWRFACGPYVLKNAQGFVKEGDFPWRFSWRLLYPHDGFGLGKAGRDGSHAAAAFGK